MQMQKVEAPKSVAVATRPARFGGIGMFARRYCSRVLGTVAGLLLIMQ